jgi:uncharacterized protein YndB with AHSA1/START domain
MTVPTDPSDIVRTILIAARRDTVFRYFTDSGRFAAWWGTGSQIEPHPGGAVRICYPGGTTASGTIVELEPPHRVVFTYGYDAPGREIPPGGSTVIVTFAEEPGGTRVTLRHTGLPDTVVSREHVQGWRYQLALFSKVVCAEQHADLAAIADTWFEAWAETDPARRRTLLATATTPDCTFRDDFGSLAGLDDLDAHIAALHIHMPGVRLTRAAAPLQTQGAALIRWKARSGDKEIAAGTNIFELAPDGRIRSAVGFWGA